MPSQPGQILSAVRIAIGVGGWFAPNLTFKLFGLDARKNPQMTFVGRLFAVREFALVASATQTSGPSKRIGWQVGIFCDVVDAIAAFAGARSGSISKGTALLSGTTALTAAGLGVAAMNAEDAA